MGCPTVYQYMMGCLKIYPKTWTPRESCQKEGNSSQGLEYHQPECGEMRLIGAEQSCKELNGAQLGKTYRYIGSPTKP